MKKVDLLKQAAQAASENKIRQDYIKKTAAAFGDFSVGSALKAVSLIGAAVVINQFVRKMLEYAERKQLKAMQPEYFEKMLKKNPSLLREDPEEVLDLFDTLYHSAPHLAQDPIAAGGFISQNIQARVIPEFGGPSIDTYKTLSEISQKSQQSRGVETSDSFTPYLMGAFGG